MKRILSERNLAVALFVLVLITFSLAQEDTRKMERMYLGINTGTGSQQLLVHQSEINIPHSASKEFLPAASAE